MNAGERILSGVTVAVVMTIAIIAGTVGVVIWLTLTWPWYLYRALRGVARPR